MAAEGITTCSLYSPDDPTCCLNGEKYPELVIADTLSGVIRGLTHIDLFGALTGAPGAPLAVGTNVSVRMGDFLTVTFANVIAAGFVEAGILSPPDYPGLMPLASFGASGPAPTAQSGQVEGIYNKRIFGLDESGGVCYKLVAGFVTCVTHRSYHD